MEWDLNSLMLMEKSVVTMKRWKTPMREGNTDDPGEGGMGELKRTSVSTRKKCAFCLFLVGRKWEKHGEGSKVNTMMVGMDDWSIV